jgi:predicted nucleic acid-binding protein
VAHGAARLVARRVVPRLGDALVAATAVDLAVPLVTANRRLARAVSALLVQDHV